VRSFLLLVVLYTFILLATSAAHYGDDKSHNTSVNQTQSKVQGTPNTQIEGSGAKKNRKTAVIDPARVVLLNNEGVKLLDDFKIQPAIAKFEEALRLAPYDQLAKENLAIAYNNWGLQLKDNPKEAIKQFHKAMLCDPNNLTTKTNLEGLIRSYLGKNPTLFKDRVELGDQARLSGDVEGAVIEYQEALRLKDDAGVKKKLEKLADVRRAMDKNATKTALPPAVVDLDRYIADVERRVKACWLQPPEVNESKCVAVFCTIVRNGKLSNVHLDHVPDGSALDRAALEAVKKAAPFPPLPRSAPNSIDIKLTLDCKVIRK